MSYPGEPLHQMQDKYVTIREGSWWILDLF